MEKACKAPQSLDLPDSDIINKPVFLGEEDAWELFRSLRSHVPWQQDQIKLFGKKFDQPRLTALYGTNGLPYSYSGIRMQPHQFTPELMELKNKVTAATGHTFTSCLLNLYRNGTDSNGWHSDNEKELGVNPVIASVSLGQSRLFRLKHRTVKGLQHTIMLDHGSLLLMRGTTQHFWLHQIPKTRRPVAERINLTFRFIQ